MTAFFYLLLAVLRLFLAFFISLLYHPLLSFLDFSVILNKLDADVVIMLTSKLNWSSVMFLDTSLGKELINWERFLSIYTIHPSWHLGF